MHTRDIHQTITERIVAAIEAGANSYQMPWNTQLAGSPSLRIPRNPVGSYAYRGINILNLWARQKEAGFSTSEWATYQQWQSIGAQVKKGEKATVSVFYKPLDSAAPPKSPQCNDDEAPNPGTTKPFIAKAAYVFNAAQVHGYAPQPPDSDIEKHAASEHLIQASGAKIILGETEAYYAPNRDQIHLPPRTAFINLQAFYGVAFHELCHWTGHETRCARNLSGRFGSEAYAIEELVAELGSAFLCAEVGIAAEPRFDHACYISAWLKVLKDDKRAVFAAAARASEAATFLTSLARLDN